MPRQTEMTPEAPPGMRYDCGLKGFVPDPIPTAKPSSDNSFGVIMSSALDAAKNVDLGMRGTDQETRRKALSSAMHSLLTIAEQCRQEFDGTAP